MATANSSVASDSFETSTDVCDTSEDSLWEDEAAPTKRTRKHNPTGVARRLVTSSKLSIYRTARLCRQHSGDGIEIPTPSQQGIYKVLLKKAAEVKQHLVSTLRCEKWSLHFDGKQIQGIKHQAVILKNKAKKIKLTVLQLKDGTAATIAKGIQGVLDDFNLWGSVLMLITDTSSVNTGKKIGVVNRLQQMFEKNGSPGPKFISCQHHVLDRILRLVMDDELHGSTKSPDIDNFFVNDLTSKYDHLKEAFSNEKIKKIWAVGETT